MRRSRPPGAAAQLFRWAALDTEKLYSTDRRKMNSESNDKKKNTPPGSMIGLGIAIGLAIGAGLGVVFDNIAIGAGAGLCVGVAIGTALEQRRKQSNDNE